MPKIAIYCRHSPRPRGDESTSCEQQEQVCRKFVEGTAAPVVVYKDKNISGATLNRPALQEMLDALGEFDEVVCSNIDRLARDQMVFYTLKNAIKERGASLNFADGTLPASTPEGELFQAILSAFAAYERAQLRKRTSRGAKAAIERKKQEGKHHGNPPIGYAVKYGVLVEDPKEQECIRMIRNLTPSDWNAQKIADYLNQNGLSIRNSQWSERSVRKIQKRLRKKNSPEKMTTSLEE